MFTYVLLTIVSTRPFPQGPIDCGNNGWYCRIYNDEVNGWPSVALNGDINFGECNKEGSFDDDYEDQDGHCHGSSDDSACEYIVRCGVSRIPKFL